ncbi:glycosyltransferase family 2 protein [Alloscardovia venturai]|uniref:Glycosyltransferase family 2 protein n=1 Tax=Alloscardovia venturai TaxID=1769421 RepID=A0ABW2Y3M2_9BIFI
MNRLHHISEALVAIDSSEVVSLADALSRVAGNIRRYTSQDSYETPTIDTTLAAVVTVEEDTRYLSDTVTSLMEQTVLPSTVLIVRNTGDSEHISTSEINRLESIVEQFPTTTHVLTVNAASFGEAITRAVNDATDRGILSNALEYLWLLHDDSRPEQADYVERLNEVRRNNSQVSVIGAKQLSWDSATLSNVGYYAHPRHNVTSLVVDGEIDQDQYNARQDMYAVSLAGAFVRIADWMRLGGFSYSAGTFGQSRDFGRRVVRAGGRIIVVPEAHIAHRRARFSGVRTRNGHVHHYDADDARTLRNSALSTLIARDAYKYSDVARPRWIYMWPVNLIMAVIRAATNFGKKMPYEALCELLLPWYDLVHVHSLSAQRSLLRNVQTVSLSQLSGLVATSDQLRVYADRTANLLSQDDYESVSPLVKKHLREQSRIRYMWLAVCAALVFIVHVTFNFDIVRGVLSGEHLVSSSLISTASTTRQLFSSATTYFSFSQLDGVALPPSPFLLVYAFISLFTFGHAWATSALIFFLGAPAAFMSVWALTGIFTRSNISRCALACAWVAFGYGSGIFSQGNIALITVMIFFPAGVAFAAKAIGVYQTEEPVQAEPSIQISAWAALCFACAVASEPQIIVAMVIVGIIMMFIYRQHALMIVSMAIPSLVILLPTFTSIVMKPSIISQLFNDISVREGASSASHVSVFTRLTGIIIANGGGALGATMMTLSSIAMLAFLGCAVATLALPSLIRPARILWISLVAALGLATVAPYIPVARGVSGTVYGMILPAMMIVVLGLLVAGSMVCGPATAHFVPVLEKDKKVHALADSSEPTKSGEDAIRRVAFGVSRAFVIVCAFALTVTWGYMAYEAHSSLTTSREALPMVVQDYLSAASNRRIAVVKLTDSEALTYSTLHSAHGDIIDSSAAVDAQQVKGTSQPRSEKVVAHALAQLAQSNSDDAVNTLSDAGIGGIYIMYDGHESAFSSYLANAAASDNAEAVVNNKQGAYVRISIKSMSDQGVATQALHRAQRSMWRYSWITILSIMILIYLALGLPSIVTRGEE